LAFQKLQPETESTTIPLIETAGDDKIHFPRHGVIHFYLTPARAKVIEVMDTLSLNLLIRYNLDAII
jgi:hypothetical protein